MMKKTKLNIRRETLRVLTAFEASNVVGGVKPISELNNCTAGTPCTAGCTTGSVNCDPPTLLNTCDCR
jgi:hypothetical protein